MHKTLHDSDFKLNESDHEFYFQTELTQKFDEGFDKFNQEVLNEIVLWKVNRYAKIDDVTINLINEIDKFATEINFEQTKLILKAMLKVKGIQLPMASTILRFINKNIYQIIDQRVYRIIYKSKKLKLKMHPSDKNLNDQIDLYLEYLRDLRAVCQKLNIPFDKSDRILFMADKRINKDISLDNY